MAAIALAGYLHLCLPLTPYLCNQAATTQKPQKFATDPLSKMKWISLHCHVTHFADA